MKLSYLGFLTGTVLVFFGLGIILKKSLFFIDPENTALAANPKLIYIFGGLVVVYGLFRIQRALRVYLRTKHENKLAELNRKKKHL